MPSERNVIIYYCLSIGLGIILLIFAFFVSGFKDDLLGNIKKSTTLLFVLFGVPGFLIFLGIRKKYIYGIEGINNNTVPNKVAKFYFEQGMALIRTVFTGYVLTLAVLWGFVLNAGLPFLSDTLI